jgi:putative spermidine/putrescine transport system permease protein
MTVTMSGAPVQAESLRRFAGSGWPLLLPGIALYGLVLVYPVAGLMLRSVRDGGGEGFSLASYAHIFSTPLFRDVLINSFATAGIVTVLCVVLGYPVAYVLYLAAPGWRRVLLALLVVPLLTSVLVRSFAWIALLDDRGPVNGLLRMAGLVDGPVPLLYNQTGLLIGMVNVMLPYCVLPIYSVMAGQDRGLMAAASSLGAGPVRAFWRVFFPLAVPGLAAGALLTFVLSLGFYITPALLGGPRQTMIAQLIESQVKNLGQFEVASALSIVLMALTIVVLVVYNRFFGLSRVFGGAIT